MRGEDRKNKELFSYIDIESRIHAKHPLRLIREVVNDALLKLSPEFERLYAREGRPSIPPERLLRALLLQAFYSIRSERLLMEQMEFNSLYKWFVGLNPDDPVWDASTFAKNRDRLLEALDSHFKCTTSVDVKTPRLG
jgi:transposase